MERNRTLVSWEGREVDSLSRLNDNLSSSTSPSASTSLGIDKFTYAVDDAPRRMPIRKAAVHGSSPHHPTLLLLRSNRGHRANANTPSRHTELLDPIGLNKSSTNIPSSSSVHPPSMPKTAARRSAPRDRPFFFSITPNSSRTITPTAPGGPGVGIRPYQER